MKPARVLLFVWLVAAFVLPCAAQKRRVRDHAGLRGEPFGAPAHAEQEVRAEEPGTRHVPAAVRRPVDAQLAQLSHPGLNPSRPFSRICGRVLFRFSFTRPRATRGTGPAPCARSIVPPAISLDYAKVN